MDWNLYSAMRIISGKLKGRKLRLPTALKARPTTDMAREGLFNILNGNLDFQGLNVLDLFCGTGAISLEFLSRGAASVVAVDIETATKRFLEKVIVDWRLSNLTVVKADVFKILRKPTGKFDVVFADPPYADLRFPELPSLILQSSWLETGGSLIVEHGPEHSYQDHPSFTQHRKYGGVNFSFFSA